MNQLRLKPNEKKQHGNEYRVIAKVNGKVRIRTYTFIPRLKGGMRGQHLIVTEGARVVEQGWSWDIREAWAWLEEHTGAVSID